MATLEELQQQITALQQKVEALTTPPTDYYTHRWSGEEIDRGVSSALTMNGAETPQAALAALGAGVRNNELDNPGLDINQRGQSSYDTSIASSYTVDRWWSIFGIYDVATKTMEATNQTYGFGFRQPINNPSRFAGKTVTLTAWILSGNGSIGIVKSTALNSGLSTIGSIAINEAGLYSKTFNIPDDVGSDTYPYLLISAGASVGGSLQFASPIPFKLEFGEGQTLAYQDSDGNWQLLPQPDSKYSAQLLECQRYQFATPNRSMWVRVSRITENSLFFEIPTPTIMRISSPSLSETDKKKFFITIPTSSSPVTGFEIVVSTNGTSIRIQANKTSHGLTDATLEIRGQVIFNANL